MYGQSYRESLGAWPGIGVYHWPELNNCTTARQAGKYALEIKQTALGEFTVSAKLREGPSQPR